MLEILKESLRDEDHKASSPRFQSLILTCVGSLIAMVALILVACSLPVSAYAIAVVGVILGKSGADTWAAQIKSAKTKVAKIQSQTSKADAKPKEPDKKPNKEDT